MFVVNFDALAQASNFQIERTQVVFLCWMQDLNQGLWNQISGRLNARWQTDWAIEDLTIKLELNSPSLWSASIQPTQPHCHLAFAPGSGDIHACCCQFRCSGTGKQFSNRKETSCLSLLNAGFEPKAPRPSADTILTEKLDIFSFQVLLVSVIPWQVYNPGPCITNVIATCRKNFSQWERSFLWKLRCHWLKFLPRVAKNVSNTGPCDFHQNLQPFECQSWLVIILTDLTLTNLGSLNNDLILISP